MNMHPYLRAYLAGVFVPTIALPVLLAGYVAVRLCLAVPVPIERFLVFPMALVPTLFGVWNMLYLGSHRRRIFLWERMARFCRWSARPSAPSWRTAWVCLNLEPTELLTQALPGAVCTFAGVFAGGDGGLLPRLEVHCGFFESRTGDWVSKGVPWP